MVGWLGRVSGSSRPSHTQLNIDGLVDVLTDGYPEQLDFPEGDLLHRLILVWVQEFLDGNEATRVPMAALEHGAVAALPDWTQRLITLHQALILKGQEISFKLYISQIYYEFCTVISQSGLDLKLSLYADDQLLYVYDRLCILSPVVYLLKRFDYFSGCKINLIKRECFPWIPYVLRLHSRKLEA